MKRDIPLFLIDTKKRHKKGECDFVVCTDKDSGFVARIDYVAGQDPEYGDNYRIDYRNGGLSIKMEIKRITGSNPSTSAIRTLMKAGMEYYVESVQLNVERGKISTSQCINFIEKLIAGNQHYLTEVKDYTERVTILTSLGMLSESKNKLYKLKLIEENGEI